MMNRLKPGGILLALLGLIPTACTTTPYTRHTTPAIHGEIRIGGEPGNAIPVYLSTGGNDRGCLQYNSMTSTGPKGQFSLGSIRKSLPYTPLMTYYLDEWIVCAEIDGQRVTLYSDNRYGMGSVSGSVYIRCHFERGRYSTSSCEHERSGRLE